MRRRETTSLTSQQSRREASVGKTIDIRWAKYRMNEPFFILEIRILEIRILEIRLRKSDCGNQHAFRCRANAELIADARRAVRGVVGRADKQTHASALWMYGVTDAVHPRSIGFEYRARRQAKPLTVHFVQARSTRGA